MLLINANSASIPLADGVVHAVVTSPPYYGLRSYAGTSYWEGGDPACDHEAARKKNRFDYDMDKKQASNAGSNVKQYESVCPECGAIKFDAQIGLEGTPEQFIANMVAVMREVRRVLRDDGVVFVNMGDSYSTGAMNGHANVGQRYNDLGSGPSGTWAKHGPVPPGYKPLDLMNIPGRLVQALQADGWYHRSTIIWAKPNPMPESVRGWRFERHRVKVAAGAISRRGTTEIIHRNNHLEEAGLATWQDCPGCEKCADNDGLVLRRGSWRPTTAHEYIFMLTKTADYFADGEAVREGISPSTIERWSGIPTRKNASPRGLNVASVEGESNMGVNPAGRNARTVWDFPTQPYPGPHFATFPEELPRRCLKSAISQGGVCPHCGAQWARVVTVSYTKGGNGGPSGKVGTSKGMAQIMPERKTRHAKSHGFRATCSCPPHEPTKAIVLDPFAGSGTTGIAARELGAHFVGLDLSFQYLHDNARERLGLAALDAWRNGSGKRAEAAWDDMPLFGGGE